MSLRRFVLLLTVLGAAGCSSGGETASVEAPGVSASAGGAGVSGPLGGVGVGVVTATVAPPSPEETAASALLDPWTLARSGDRVCSVDLGSRNAAGERGARTRNCMSVELARIAFWTVAGQRVVLYDFERRPVVALDATGPGAYEGAMADGTRLTLWR